MKQRYVTVSLCMIVRDAEPFIERCLNSIQNAVDEIIIVDTGSVDATRQICRKYTEHVLDHKWEDDFSQARNAGLRHATGDWIMWMDADEELDRKVVGRIGEKLADISEPLALVELVNFYGEAPADRNRSYSLAHHRLFRNHAGFFFKYAIHEQLNVEEVVVSDTALHILPITIFHYGYMDEPQRAARKSERNMALLSKEKAAPDARANPWLDYHLASEHYRLNEYGTALELLNGSIRQFVESGRLPPSLVYKMKYEILLGMGQIESVVRAIDKAIELYPDYVDLHFYKGMALFMMRRYEEALLAYEHCLFLGDKCSVYLTKKGTGSFYALYYAGQCQDQLGLAVQASLSYAEAARLNSSLAHMEKQRIAAGARTGGGG